MTGDLMKKMIARMSRAELETLSTHVLDKEAFGFESGDVLDVPVRDIFIKYDDDLAQARLDVQQALDAVALAKRIHAKREPVEITVRKGRLELEDGHHRYVSAKLLKRKTLPAVVTIDDNPIDVILAKR